MTVNIWIILVSYHLVILVSYCTWHEQALRQAFTGKQDKDTLITQTVSHIPVAPK